jgi:arginyl-tRNA synthetase
VLQEQITLAPENVEGDLAFPCFKIAKEFAKNPAELAKDLAEKLNKELESQATTHQLFSSFLAL